MLPEIEQLLVLQEKDQRLQSFQRELDAIPKEKEARELQLTASATRLEQSKARSKELEVARKELEGGVESKLTQIGRYKTQQMETRKNEEYQALAHEIETAQKAISALEDRELEIMEELETLRPAIASAEQLFSDEKARIHQQLASLEEKTTNLRGRLAEGQAEAAALGDKIEEDLVEIYRRLFKTKNGQAIVPLDGEICTGCHVKVTTQTVVAARSQKTIVHCPQCGRIVYFQS